MTKLDWMKRCSGDNCNVCVERNNKGSGNCLSYNQAEADEFGYTKITSAEQNAEYIKILEKLLDSTTQKRIDRLAELISAYEDEKYKFDPPTLADRLSFRLEQSGKNFNHFIKIIGSKSKAYQLLAGTNTVLSKNQMKRLHDGIGMPYELMFELEGK